MTHQANHSAAGSPLTVSPGRILSLAMTSEAPGGSARGLDDAEERAGLEDRAERRVRERREARRAAARPEDGLLLIGVEPWRRDARRRAAARFEDGLLPVVPQEFELGRPARASLARFALLDRFAGQCSRADRPCSGVRQGEDHREALHQHVLEGLLATCRTREAEFCGESWVAASLV